MNAPGLRTAHAKLCGSAAGGYEAPAGFIRETPVAHVIHTVLTVVLAEEYRSLRRLIDES
jgi:hypothetical protein